MAIGLGVGPAFKKGFSWSSYWTTQAQNANNADSVANIHYALTGTDYQVKCYVPVKNSKIAYYNLAPSTDGTIELNGAEIGAMGFGTTSRYNYDSNTGTWSANLNSTHYTADIGATMTFAFTGTKIDFYSYTEVRGGIWSFVIDGGTPILISCYAADAGFKLQTITDSLAEGNHTIVGTFTGQDPLHPNATPRVYAYYGDEITTGMFGVAHNAYTKDKDIMPASLVEYAFRIKKFGAVYAESWVPYHGDVTITPVSREVLVDDVAVADFTANNISPCQTIKINAVYTGFNINEAEESLLTITLNQVIDKLGYHVTCNIKALQKISINNYAFMFAIHRAFGTSLKANNTSYDITDSDGVADVIANGDAVKSLQVTSTLSGCTNYQLTASFTEACKRIGQSDRGLTDEDEIIWIENRNDATIQKVYVSTYRSSTLDTDDEATFGSDYYIGCIS